MSTVQTMGGRFVKTRIVMWTLLALAVSLSLSPVRAENWSGAFTATP
jgi:hypothetical protein